MLLLPIFLLGSTLLTSAATLPTSIVIIVPPNSTVVSEEIGYGASFAPAIDPTSFGYSTRIQTTLTAPNGTRSAPSTIHDRACTDSPPPVLGGFNTGGLNFSGRAVVDVVGVWTIDVSARFGFPPAGSDCASGDEEFQFRNSSASFEVLPLPAGSPSIIIGTDFGLVTRTFGLPTGVVEGGNVSASTTATGGTGVNATGGSIPVPTPTGGSEKVGVPLGLIAACAVVVSMW